ncbi:MAG: DUF429 domain-containing protein [Oscillochloridaceae bacterium umkhey_bin13]
MIHSPTIYIGLDLAWSGRNLSGAATLQGDQYGAQMCAAPVLLRDLDAIVAYVDQQAGRDDAIVAVDAPLRVPNQTGQRPADAALSAAFRRYEAGAHPVNRRLLDRDGTGVRGEQLVDRLTALGFAPAAHIAAGQPGRLICEVYPHPALVVLFGLTKSLKYKARQGRAHEIRLAEWQRYQAAMRSLAQADPPLGGDLSLLDPDLAGLGATALKHYEDQVDALCCAYLALYLHRWGTARSVTFGDLATGWIITPKPPPQPQ